MIYIGFSTNPKNWLSKLIRWATKSQVSHSFIVFQALGRDWILESGHKGVAVAPIESLRSQFVALVPIPELTEGDIARVMADDLGENYDYGGLFGMAWNVIGRWFKVKWNNPLNDSKAMFCSEFLVKALQQCRFPGADRLEASNTTPQDLLDFLTEHYVRKA